MTRPGTAEAAAVVLTEAIERHQALLSHATELGDARRELAEAEDESWSVRVSQANKDRLAADTRVVAQESDQIAESGESVFQKMLDNEAWRRGQKKRHAS